MVSSSWQVSAWLSACNTTWLTGRSRPRLASSAASCDPGASSSLRTVQSHSTRLLCLIQECPRYRSRSREASSIQCRSSRNSTSHARLAHHQHGLWLPLPRLLVVTDELAEGCGPSDEWGDQLAGRSALRRGSGGMGRRAPAAASSGDANVLSQGPSVQ